MPPQDQRQNRLDTLETIIAGMEAALREQGKALDSWRSATDRAIELLRARTHEQINDISALRFKVETLEKMAAEYRHDTRAILEVLRGAMQDDDGGVVGKLKSGERMMRELKQDIEELHQAAAAEKAKRESTERDRVRVVRATIGSVIGNLLVLLTNVLLLGLTKGWPWNQGANK